MPRSYCQPESANCPSGANLRRGERAPGLPKPWRWIRPRSTPPRLLPITKRCPRAFRSRSPPEKSVRRA
jgi:hypothetical protein